jgi:hypothetical protein
MLFRTLIFPQKLMEYPVPQEISSKVSGRRLAVKSIMTAFVRDGITSNSE